MMYTSTHSMRLYALFLCAVALLLSACEQNNHEQPLLDNATAKVAWNASGSSGADGNTTAQSNGAASAQSEQTTGAAAIQRQMIYTATLRMRVESVDKSHDSVLALLGRYQAYVGSDNRTSYSERTENRIVIRVERSQFWGLLKAVEKQAVHLDEKKVNSEDVTGAIADIQEHIKSKMAAEQQYREILQRAVNVQDILNVQKYLSDIREEIELMQSRLDRLTDQAAYSTITIDMYERGSGTLSHEETFWDRAGDAAANGWHICTSLLIVLVTVWPFWIVAGAAAYGVFRYSKKKPRTPLVPTVVVPQEQKSEDNDKPIR